MPVWSDQQVARLHIAVHHALFVSGKKRACGLRDDVENSVDGEALVAFENLRERITRHQFHNQERAARIFSVIKNVSDSVMIHSSRVTSLSSKSLEKARVAEILGFQNLDCDIAKNNFVFGLPNFTHAADGNARN